MASLRDDRFCDLLEEGLSVPSMVGLMLRSCEGIEI
jgi:hypothetical protein